MRFRNLVLAVMLVLSSAYLIGCSNSNNNPSSPTSPAVAGRDWYSSTLSAAFSPRGFHTSLVYDPATGSGTNGKMWVIAGLDGSYPPMNDIWYSANGKNWTQATSSASFAPRLGHTSFVYDPSTGSGSNGKMWVIGGSTGSTPFYSDVWWSMDGVNWTAATSAAAFGGRAQHTSVVFNNEMWVISGRTYPAVPCDVWYSTDGVAWVQATASPGFSSREGHASVVYNNKMWVIGGYDTSNIEKNDVWYSSDGVIWTQATASAAFSPREGHTSFVYQNLMWVIGGASNGYVMQNDVWYSADGINWTQATAAAPFSARWGLTSLVFKNLIWVFGGGIGTPQFNNDVWYSP